MKQPLTRFAELRKPHEHKRCVAAALRAASRICERRALKLTPLRKEILELVWARHAPIGAYDLLEQLHQRRSRAAPPTIYRALEFLEAAGLVHRIHSLNAYLGCEYAEQTHTPHFLVCQSCHAVAEFGDPTVDKYFNGKATTLGFTEVISDLEIKGLCTRCHAA